MTDPAPARRVGHQPTLLQLRGWVHYHQVYLLEAGSDLSGMLDDGLASPVGIICVQPGSAFLTTGLHTGAVGFTVAVADRDPGADLDTYEDVVEISYDSPTGIVWLEEWGGEGSHTLPPLAGGPGWYRLRYHARGMDAAQQADTSEEPIDEYLLQIWPEPHKEPAVVKLTSDTAQYWIDHSAQA